LLQQDLGLTDLEKYKTQGNDFLVYDWVNVSKEK
jgi:hypothetical protein